MERSRVTRYIRIAVTALSLTACVLLIALWLVVSISRHSFQTPIIGNTDEPPNENGTQWEVRLGRSQVKLQTLLPLEWSPYLVEMTTVDRFGFNWWGSRRELFIAIPYWFLIVLSVMVASAPWIRWSKRFGLRTLLIATTLLAVILGVAFAVG